MNFPFFKKSKSVAGSMIRAPRVMPGHADILRTVNRRMVRMYEAAVTNNLNFDFPVSITSANAEILTSISNTRSRARVLERDNPYGQAIIESLQNNVGGEEPFRLEMKIGQWVDGEFVEETETNRLIEDAWEEAGYPENCTVRRDMSRLEMDLQAIAAVVRDGGILYRHYPGFPKNDFRYAIEPIEMDRLDQYYNRPAGNGVNEIQFSIEMDEFHGPIKYWILARHPGDVFVAWSAGPRYREEVPAENIIALFALRSRAGQYVGISKFASVIQRLHRVDQFDVAHVTAAIWASCKPFFITQEFPTAMEYVPDFIKTAMSNAMAGAGEGEGDKVSNVEPGTGEVLPYGQKPVLVDPKFPIEAAAGFKKDNLRAAASGSGAPYHVIGNDLESVNFSSARIGLEAFHDTCKILQRHFILNLRRPHFNKWLEYAILSGRLDLPLSRLKEFQRSAKFFGRRWAYINPLQDVQADILRVNAGLTSRSRVIAESDRGGDAEEVDSENASDKKSAKLHGMDYNAEKPSTKDEETEAPEKNGKANGRVRFARATD